MASGTPRTMIRTPMKQSPRNGRSPLEKAIAALPKKRKAKR